MDERTRFQFSIWNLMLSMVPLAVVFSLASLARDAGSWVWFAAVIVGVGPAVGALVGGLAGMGRVVFWTVLVAVWSPAVLFLAYLVQPFISDELGPQLWGVCVALSPVIGGAVIGARRGGRRWALVGLCMGMILVIALIVVLFAYYQAK
jgi:hypothetical protein